jgi:hypothetical protein
MEPKLELKHARQQNNPGRGDAVQVEAVCHVPGLDVEASNLLLHVEHKIEGYHRVPESIGAGTMQVATVDTPKRPGSDPSHQRLPYFMLKPMTDEETGRVKGVRVRYADEKIVDSNKDHFFAFLTHTTPNGYEIPAPRSDNKQADDDSDRNFLTDRVLV